MRRKPAPDQVRFTDSVTIVTDSEVKLPLFLKRKTQSFPHLSVNKLRVYTKPAFWNGPLNYEAGFGVNELTSGSTQDFLYYEGGLVVIGFNRRGNSC